MHSIDWFCDTNWQLNKYLSPNSKKISIVANTLFRDISKIYYRDLTVFLNSEPPEIVGGIVDYCLKNYIHYDYVLTWNEEILYKCHNARKFTYIAPWITDNFEEKEKKFKISFLRGEKHTTYGQHYRWSIYKSKDKIKIPTTFYDIIPFKRKLREEYLFSDSQFNIAIENSFYNNYFTEKILDCFLTKTIPIYLGCPNIEKIFDINGIIVINSFEDFFDKVNNLNEFYYQDHIESINTNYNIAKEMSKDSGQEGSKVLERKINELMKEKFNE